MSSSALRKQSVLGISALMLLLFLYIPLGAQQAAEKEPNNEASQANPLPLNGEIRGYANEREDEDWYLLNIPAPGMDILLIDVSGVPGIDLTMTLYDAAGKALLAMDGRKEAEGETIVRLRQPPGKLLPLQ